MVLNATSTIVRTCTKCSICYPDVISNFRKSKRKKDGTYSYAAECKKCAKAYHAQRYKENTQEIRARNDKWKEENLEKLKAYYKRYGIENAEARKEYRKQYYQDPANKERHKRVCKDWNEQNLEKTKLYRTQHYQENKAYYVAKDLKRSKAERKATPAWCDLTKCQEFYAEARRLTEETGIPHQVDHVDPIQGRLVCGMHVHNNLQVLTLIENNLKRHKFTPYGIDKDGNRYELLC